MKLRFDQVISSLTMVVDLIDETPSRNTPAISSYMEVALFILSPILPEILLSNKFNLLS